MDVGRNHLHETNFAWLLRLRWGAILSQAITLIVVELGLGLSLALRPLFAIVGLTALSNVLCEVWRRRGGHTTDASIAGVMALDFVLLTGLLYLAGGPSNPFSVLYLVHVALSAALLRPAFAWALATLSTGLYGLLFLLPARHDAVLHAMGMHEHAAGAGIGLHYQGMWVAFTIAAFVIVYFVTRIAKALNRAREMAAAERARAARSERLASLATLAAGAAHELGSPLSTIAVAARELELSLTQGRLHADALLDVQAVRSEVERCRAILAQMATDAGAELGEPLETVTLSALLREVRDDLREGDRVELHVSDVPLHVPRRALAQALRALIKNALEASEARVVISERVEGSVVHIDVRDEGAGMPAEVLSRVGEPFFTTKPTGRGMGLGVFLSRLVFERLGGGLAYESRAGEGTRAAAFFRTHLSTPSGDAKVRG